jgi:hypothetical protein
MDLTKVNGEEYLRLLETKWALETFTEWATSCLTACISSWFASRRTDWSLTGYRTDWHSGDACDSHLGVISSNSGRESTNLSKVSF